MSSRASSVQDGSHERGPGFAIPYVHNGQPHDYAVAKKVRDIDGILKRAARTLEPAARDV